jgi:PKD repeat protein
MKTTKPYLLVVFLFIILNNQLLIDIHGNITSYGCINSGLSSWVFWKNNGQGARANLNMIDGKLSQSNHTKASELVSLAEISRMSKKSAQTIDDQSFIEKNEFSLSGVIDGTALWGDYDNDGDLDILLASGRLGKAEIYKNDLPDSIWFTRQDNIILAEFYGASWGDYDNDGDMDIIGSGDSKIYKNDLPDSAWFTEQYTIPLSFLMLSKVEWADFDNDGDLDFIITGIDTNNTSITKLFWQTNNYFVESEIFFLGGRDMCVLDYNSDNYADIIITGMDNEYSGKHTSVYKNEIFEYGVFSLQRDIELPRVWQSSVNCGDYNNDGFVDILLNGVGNLYGHISDIYLNTGEDFLLETSTQLTGVWYGTSTCGDYDNDGDLDILLTGQDKNDVRISKIYKNNLPDAFGYSEQEQINLEDVTGSSCDWGDYDNDGDLDILLSGYIGNGGLSKIYENIGSKSNTKPKPPINLKHEISENQVRIFWDRATDAETSSQSLSYNVQIRTSDNRFIVSPLSDSETGYLRKTGMGNAYLNNEFILNFSDTGTYYWSVQSIDNGFQYSEFSTEQSFRILYPFTPNTQVDLRTVIKSSVAWGDYNNDDYLDFVFSGIEGIKVSGIYENNKDESFSDVSANLADIDWSYSDWGDYDNDGDLDILIMGVDTNEKYITKIYKNNLPVTNGFTELSNLNLKGFAAGTCKWGDYDNDGDLDFIISGESASEKITLLYKNNDYGSKGFSEDINVNLDGIWFSCTSWGDYDNDGDLDILLMGKKNTSYYISKVYKNNGNGSFTEQTDIKLSGAATGSALWGDYDCDGDLDILIAGFDANVDPVFNIYRNDGNNIFTNIYPKIRTGINNSAAWGDYNNDGFLDIVYTGGSGSLFSKLYKNNKNDTFSEIETELTGVEWSSSVWGDYNNDGSLDIFLSGNTDAVIYKNNTNNPNHAPTIPKNLRYELTGFNIKLSWDIAYDPDYPEGSVYYNVRMGTSPDKQDIISPMANLINGYRKKPAMGNAQCNTFFIIKNLVPNKMYYWTVQAIDQSFTGGPWAPLDSFMLTEVSPNFTFDTVCQGNHTVFTDLSETTDTIITWKWFFGDDSTSVLQNPSHLYQIADTFNVTLWAFTQSGDSAGRTRQVIVKMSPSASFIADTICTGIKTTFTSTSNNKGLTITSWQWIFGDNDNSTSEGSVQHLYAADGSYHAQLILTADNSCTNSFSGEVQVGKVPAPVITYIYGGSILCEGDSAIIQAVQVPLPTYTYKWYRNGDLQSNNQNSYIIRYAGEYKTEVMNTIGNCKSESLPDTINVYERPDTVIIQTMNYDPNACSGTQLVTLTAEPNSELYQYRWYYNDALVVGAYSSQYTDYLKDGNYKVMVGSGQCEVSSQSFNLSFKSTLPKPQIYTMGPVVWILACSNDTVSEYKWYYNGTLLPEARKPLYVANKQTGYYYVRISDGNGCYTSSDTILIGEANKGAFNEDDKTIILYPNPNDGTFNLYYQSNLTGIINLEIYNVLGESVYSDQYSKTDDIILENINLKGLSPGYYMIQVKMDNSVITRQLIIENN